MSAEELRRQKESDSGQGGTGSQSTVAIPEDKGDTGLQHLCFDGCSEHFPFLWPKYPAGPYLALPGGGCLAELSWLLAGKCFLNLLIPQTAPPSSNPTAVPHSSGNASGMFNTQAQWRLPPHTFWSIVTLGKPASNRTLLEAACLELWVALYMGQTWGAVAMVTGMQCTALSPACSCFSNRNPELSFSILSP